MSEMHTAPKKLGQAYMVRSQASHSAPPLNQQGGENEPGANMGEDPNILHLHELVAAFRTSEAETKRLRNIVDKYIQELKKQGYSYTVLARESTFAQGTIQLIVAKDPDQAPDLQ